MLAINLIVWHLVLNKCTLIELRLTPKGFHNFSRADNRTRGQLGKLLADYTH